MRKGSLLITFLILMAMLGVATANLYGQAATASATLQGTVTDASGALVPNAELRITHKETGAARTTTSGAEGQYRFDLLAPGTYEVRCTMRGFAVAAYQNAELAVGRTTTIDVSLQPSTQQQTVTVEAGGAVLVDLQKTDVSRPVRPSELQELPLNGRDFVNLALLAPGARQVDSYDPTKMRIGVFATNGSNGRNVNITVNGIDNKDNTVGGPVMQLPLEAIQEFNISTQRFSAANGRSEGAAVNLITRGGTNDFHGALYFFDRHETFNALNYFEKKENGGSGEKSPYSRQQFGGSVGGPLKKDQTFLFFALERAREQTSININPSSFSELNLVKNLGAEPVQAMPTPYFDWRYNGRLDHRFNEKHSLSLSYSNQNNRGENDQSGTNNDLTAGNFTTNQLILASASLNSVLTPTVVNSFTAGFQYWNNLIDSTKYVPQLIFPSAVFGTNTNVPQQSFQRKWQFRDDVAITRGKHSFRTGFDYVWAPVLGGFFIFNATPNITFFDDPSVILNNKTRYPQSFATPGAIQSISDTSGNPYFKLQPKMFGVYFQDDWKVLRNLTVNLGLRWDRDFNLNGGREQVKNRAYLRLKAINSPWAGGLPHDDTKDFSPRIGIAWDLKADGKHVLRLGYGLYYGQTFINIPLFMLQQTNPTLFTQVFYNSGGPGDPNADIVPGANIKLSAFRYGIDTLPPKPAPATDVGPSDVSRPIDPNYRNPYTQQWNAGYTWAVTNNAAIEVEYVHVLGLHDAKSIVINPRQVSAGNARNTDAPLRAAGLGLLGQVRMNQPIGRNRYDGLNLAYRKRMTRHFSLNTSYVLSRAVGYNGASASFGNAPTNLNDIFAKHDFGPTGADERHRWVLSGIVDLPGGVKFAPIMQLASARPYQAFEGVNDTYGFGGGQGSTHALVLKSDPANLVATKTYTAAQLRACLATGDCYQVPYDYMRGQRFFQLDTRLSKTVRLGEKARLELIFQAFDLTNRANFGANYRTSIRAADFGKPIGFITPSGVVVPRSFSGEFGARFSF
jgi:hypothetical protein